MSTKVSCPTCQTEVVWNAQSEYRPFCSKRCQLIDLGEWSMENHKITSPLQQDYQLSELDKQKLIEEAEAMLAQNQDSFFKD
ncbi:DNA gyrase inhibitor YacG [Pseudoalteromonas fenneropenaei]|uniref:DNA gyrase inhibitor YacG n=1 Tax=Pseudoalteromonas fenneropenaei TaxID=1737459 RepID=A0ABV7CIV6_9GAMM